jgi:hypothetical protein
MVAALISNIVLLSPSLFSVLLALELAFYALAIVGGLRRVRKIIWFSAPYYSMMINLALLFGFFRFITGTQQATWKRDAR